MHAAALAAQTRDDLLVKWVSHGAEAQRLYVGNQRRNVAFALLLAPSAPCVSGGLVQFGHRLGPIDQPTLHSRPNVSSNQASMSNSTAGPLSRPFWISRRSASIFVSSAMYSLIASRTTSLVEPNSP